MKKLILIVLFALIASACGGSDGADNADANDEVSTEDASDTSDTEQSESSDDGDSTESDDGGSDAAEAVETLEPLTVEVVQERDCAHSSTELGGDADDAGAEVPLPPASKPDVDEEFLVDVDQLITTDLIEGTGAEAVPGATVDMQYVGVLANGGEQFDASWDRGAQPFNFQLGAGRVIQGWDEGIEGMKVGGRRVLQIPAALAYGDRAQGDVIAANSDLVFIVDLVAVSPPPEPAPPISDDNLGSFGELNIIDLVEGEGCTAEYGDIVTVNYVGVDAVEGVEFDSSWGRGVPFTVVVGRSQVIDGWNAGIEGMKVGGERILQIPAGMAYNEGDLVFRIHLEALIEAPEIHKISFVGPTPADLQITSLIEGEGDGVAIGDIIDANIVVMLHNDGTIVQSSWQQGAPANLVIQPATMLPGLAEGMEGVKVGERRQIIIPAAVAYPGGVPQQTGIESDDAIVFIVEPLRITKN